MYKRIRRKSMHRIKGLCRYPFTCMAVMLTLFSLLLGVSAMSTSHIAYASDNGCHLNSAGDNIHHVIYLQFDNVHFTRDNPNVPSDLEQMPHLLNFLKSNGVLLTNDHTALIAHTATGILTAVTGLYPDSHGVPVSNSLRYFNPDGTTS